MKRILVIAAFVFGAQNASAAGGYGMAGCGLGSIVFGQQKGMVQIFAATTNGTFGSQTFGISSGTSNCKEGTASAASIQQKDFIANNINDLRKEVAQGQGETLRAFASLLGCSDASYDSVAGAMKQNYDSVFSSTAADSVLDSAKSVIGSQTSCQPTI